MSGPRYDYKLDKLVDKSPHFMPSRITSGIAGVSERLKDGIQRINSSIVLPVVCHVLAAKNFKAMDHEAKQKMFQGVLNAHEITDAFRATARETLKDIDDAFQFTHRRYLQYWLESIIVATWTMAESLFEDLWVEAVNVKPMIFIDFEGNGNDIHNLSEAKHIYPKGQQSKAAQEDGQQKGKNEQKKIPIYELYEVTEKTFNASGKMGSVLRSRFDFRTLSDIRNAYSRSFYGPDTATRRTRDVIYGLLADSRLDALSALRNLIVHRSGRPDSEYNKWKAVLSILPSADASGVIMLNGDIVKTIMEGAIECGAKLIQAVDSWIMSRGPEYEREENHKAQKKAGK